MCFWATLSMPSRQQYYYHYHYHNHLNHCHYHHHHHYGYQAHVIPVLQCFHCCWPLCRVPLQQALNQVLARWGDCVPRSTSEVQVSI